MLVRMIREKSIDTAGPLGPRVRVLAVGDVLELPDMHATMLVMGGDAVSAADRAQAPADTQLEEPPADVIDELPADDTVDAEAITDEVPATRRKRKG